MDKSTHFKLLIILLFAFMANTLNLKGQGSCVSPSNLVINSGFDTIYAVNDSVLWISFTANSPVIEFYAYGNTNISELQLYSGTCSSLTLLKSSDNRYLSEQSLNTDESYFLKINFNQIGQNIVELSSDPKVCKAKAVLSISPNPVCLGDIVFFDITGSNLCPTYFYVWDLDGFQGTLIPPDYYITNNAGVFNIKLYVGVDTIYNGIQDTLLYDSATVQLIVHDSLPQLYFPDVVCAGDTVNYYDSTFCPVATSWNWNFGDGYTSTLQNPSHIYSQPGTYTVSLQTFPGGNSTNKAISVIQATPPIISGYKNNCDSVVLYSIENFDTNYTYTWSTQVYNQTTNQYTSGQYIINGNSNVETANTANINWNTASFPTLPDYVLVTVEAHLKGRNCSAISTMKITQCCSFNGYGMLHDTTIYSDTTFTNVNQLVINGTVTFSGGVTFDNSNIFLGPLAKIVVDNNSKFESINTSFVSKECLYMNDGIYAETQNDSIVFRSNSQLSSSINGLYSSHGAYLKVDSSIFIDNLIGIQINDHKQVLFPIPPPAFTPGEYIITNCDFSVTDIPMTVLTYPYNGVQPLTGITINNVQGVTIGDSLLGGNTFSKLRNGITIYNAKANIYNNQFIDIENFMGSAAVSEAAISINSLSAFNMNNIGDVVIGSAANSAKNVFDSCEKSIYSNNSKLLVNNNVFKYGHQSIDVYNFKNGTKIEYNRFKDIYFGIRINNLLGVNRKLDVYNNFFEGQSDNTASQISREAINLINCNSQYNSNIKTQIANNTIKFTGIKNSVTRGIRIQNCDGAMVNSNFISRMINPSDLTNDWNITEGIKVATSQGAQVTDNYILGFGKSISTFGDLTGTQFSCNEFLIYMNGFYWGTNTSLSHQGLPYINTSNVGRNNHNQWNTSIASSMHLANPTTNIQNSTPINWYYSSAFGPMWEPNSVGSPYIINATINNNSSHSCVGGAGPNVPITSSGNGIDIVNFIENIEDPELRDFMFEDLMQGEEYLDLQNEYRSYDADFLFKMLDVDTTMMWLGGNKDTDYQKFFDSIQNSNIGEFYNVYKLIEGGEFDAAIEANNAIVPKLDIFVNMKTVLGIYLNSWCKEHYNLTEDEYSTLFDIANQTPYTGGDAVYTARIMIGYEPDDYGVAYRIKPSNISDEKQDLLLYPNPASDNVIIEFTNDNFENINAQLSIYTLTGKFISNNQFSTNNSFKILSVGNLKNGVYIYHISISNGIDKSGKLVILKQ